MTAGGWRLPFGANLVAGGVEFRVWAPGHAAVDVILYGPAAQAVHPLAAEDDGWFAGRVDGAGAGARYRYRLDGEEAFPDPASRSQPDGVHGASEVVDPARFRWTDAGWTGVPLEEMVLYELHVGAATEEGTFDALIGRLDDLAALGVTAVEPMPVASFPGARNWGYDGVALFAPAASYGGPEGLRRLVDAAHARGVAVVLDVVYNHLGPEGNYLHTFTGGRYFTGRHHTPWGDAVNFDGPDSAAVREFVIQNALLLLSPYTPLLWMGQEWAASTPFPYFTDHPPELGRLVTEGRRREFGRFAAFSDPAARERIPYPQSAETFLRSRLKWDERLRMPHAGVLALYRELLALRRTHPALRRRDRASFAVAALGDHALALWRSGADGSALLLAVSFSGPLEVELGRMDETRAPAGRRWELLLATEEARFGGEAEGEVVTLSADGRLALHDAGGVVLLSVPGS